MSHSKKKKNNNPKKKSDVSEHSSALKAQLTGDNVVNKVTEWLKT